MNQGLLAAGHIKELCRAHHFLPSKQYGQHFLISDEPIKQMLVAADLKPTDTIIEIGPGFGVLTLAVAPLVKKVIAFEIEKKLQPYWEEKQSRRGRDPATAGKEYKNIEIVWGDFVKIWKSVISNQKSAVGSLGSASRRLPITDYQLPKNYKVLANLPYQITSHVLRLFLESEYKPERMVLMVQKEVAERICAQPGDMSLLAVSVQYYGEPKIIAMAPRGNFWPQPKVDSAVVSVRLKPPSAADHRLSPLVGGSRRGVISQDEQFFRLVKAGFAQPRKQLWRNLASGLKLDPARVKSALREIIGNEKARAEELGVEEWRKLAEAIHSDKYNF